MAATTKLTAQLRALRVVGVVAGVLFVVGLAVLALAVYVPLPGWLGRWNDPTAWEPTTIQVLLGVLAFGAWVWPNRRRERAFSLVFLALGTATVLVLGTASYARCPDATLSAGWSVASRVIGFLLGNYDVSGFVGANAEGVGECGSGVPLALQFARLVQLVVLFVAASRAVAALLRGQLDRTLVRAGRRIVLVVGADEASARLLPALAADRGATYVIVTSDPTASWVHRARGAGWRVVAGDASDIGVLRPLLRRGRHRHALRKLAVLPADSTSTQRLVRSVERAIEGTRSTHTVNALLRIDDAWQAEDWRRRYLGRAAEWVVDTISADEVTARLVVEDALRSGGDRLVVVGRSGLTLAVLAEIAQQSREHAVLGESVVPDVVVLDPHASEVLDQHTFGQRRFGNESELRAAAGDAEVTIATLRTAVAGSMAPVILFTGEPAGEDRIAPLLGAEQPTWLVYFRLAEVAGLGTEPLLARVYAYGSTLDAGGRPVGNWERIARLGHERYAREHPDPDIPSRRPWDGLHPFYRASNVRQVLATLQSAVAVGRSWGAADSDPSAGTPGSEQLEQMAQLEHESWRAHLLERGWRHDVTRDDDHRRHPDLLPWDELGDDAREKTRAGVISSLELLATLGYRSFDEPEAAWRTVRRGGVVFARRRDEAWTWTTPDGQTLRGGAGDWEVFDSRGHSHSVAASLFEASHQRIDGDRWRRVGTVQVRRARAGERIESLEGAIVANAGEWVVRGGLGEEWIVSAERLSAGYEAGDLSN